MAVLLTEEIIMEEIVIRLPMKSLIRCRCVCKSWKSQLYNPDFLSHLNHRRISQRREEEDYLILKNSYAHLRPPYNVHLSILSRKKLSETRINYNYVPYPLSLSAFHINLVGSINGLVCMAFHVEGNHQFVLWNPTIRFSKKISVPKHLCGVSFGGDCYPMMYGFGWDSVTNDYKLIAKPSICRVSQAGIYSCITDCWSNINNVDYYQLHVNGESPSAIVNGSPYWQCYGKDNYLYRNIFKFNTSNNEFTYLKAPSECHFHYGTRLIDLHDCLGFIEYKRCDASSSIAPFVVYRFDEQLNIWMHMYTIDKCVIKTWGDKVYSFKYGGEIMFVDMEHLYLYDPKSREIKSQRRCINCGGCLLKSRSHKTKRCPSHDCGNGYLTDVFSYNPSLVTIPGMKALHL